MTGQPLFHVRPWPHGPGWPLPHQAILRELVQLLTDLAVRVRPAQQTLVDRHRQMGATVGGESNEFIAIDVPRILPRAGESKSRSWSRNR